MDRARPPSFPTSRSGTWLCRGACCAATCHRTRSLGRSRVNSVPLRGPFRRGCLALPALARFAASCPSAGTVGGGGGRAGRGDVGTGYQRVGARRSLSEGAIRILKLAVAVPHVVLRWPGACCPGRAGPGCPRGTGPLRAWPLGHKAGGTARGGLEGDSADWETPGETRPSYGATGRDRPAGHSRVKPAMHRHVPQDAKPESA